MKKLWFLLPVFALAFTPAWADDNDDDDDDDRSFGGYYSSGFDDGQDSYRREISIGEALKSRDDRDVVLVGRIVKQVGDDDYILSDGKNRIRVEIDDDDWNGLRVGKRDSVRIFGEIDRDDGRVEVDVERIEKAR